MKFNDLVGDYIIIDELTESELQKSFVDVF